MADAHAGDECLVSARGVSTGNADYITEAVRVAVEKGDLDFASGGTDPANYTGRHLRLGGSAAPVIPAGSQDDNSVAVSWGSWRVEGFDPGADPNDPSDDVPKDDVCSVDEEGVVRAGEAAAVADVCKVYAGGVQPGLCGHGLTLYRYADGGEQGNARSAHAAHLHRGLGGAGLSRRHRHSSGVRKWMRRGLCGRTKPREAGVERPWRIYARWVRTTELLRWDRRRCWGMPVILSPVRWRPATMPGKRRR